MNISKTIDFYLFCYYNNCDAITASQKGELMNQLRTIRRSKNISQKELARKLGVTQGAISCWECGRWYPSLEMLRKLAQVFNCTIDELVGDCDDERRI